MHAGHDDAMELRAMAQRYTGPSAGEVAQRIPHPVAFDRGWFRTSTAVCHGGGEPDGLAFRQRPDGNGIDVRCHSRGCTRAHAVTAIEGAIGMPIWTAYDLVTEAAEVRSRRRPPLRKVVVAGGFAALLAAPLALGHSAETALANAAAFGVAGLLLVGLPARARRAFRS